MIVINDKDAAPSDVFLNFDMLKKLSQWCTEAIAEHEEYLKDIASAD
jgi:hypothetical protein